MIDIEVIKGEIIERLLPLKPEKIILFGSYAYGAPDKESDIDLFLIKELNSKAFREYRVDARMLIRGLIKKYKIGFDILCASEDFLRSREDYFYKVDILQKGIVIYGKQ
ncbi:MAG: nucleotidyltransferase domain-containing protein [Spirochaetales bacterium]|nr:nucleotidyltransferase domain-containing protein [Spirochaetales bacterium]